MLLPQALGLAIPSARSSLSPSNGLPDALTLATASRTSSATPHGPRPPLSTPGPRPPGCYPGRRLDDASIFASTCSACFLRPRWSLGRASTDVSLLCPLMLQRAARTGPGARSGSTNTRWAGERKSPGCWCPRRADHQASHPMKISLRFKVEPHVLVRTGAQCQFSGKMFSMSPASDGREFFLEHPVGGCGALEL